MELARVDSGGLFEPFLPEVTKGNPQLQPTK